MTIALPVTHQPIASVVWGIPITNEVNAATAALAALVPTAWTAVTFQNSWVNFGSGEQNAQYRKIGDIVYLRGVIKTGTLSTVAFTLPTGFRPPAPLSFPASSANALGIISLTAAGAVTPVVGSSVAFHLNGVTFSVTA